MGPPELCTSSRRQLIYAGSVQLSTTHFIREGGYSFGGIHLKKTSPSTYYNLWFIIWIKVHKFNSHLIIVLGFRNHLNVVEDVGNRNLITGDVPQN
jgi:hypothetical protein